MPPRKKSKVSDLEKRLQEATELGELFRLLPLIHENLPQWDQVVKGGLIGSLWMFTRLQTR